MTNEGGIPARPTIYKGIKMRSRLEADYAAWLDKVGWSWEYEPQCFASEDGQWLPDFAVSIFGSPSHPCPPVLIELKPDYLRFPIDEDLDRFPESWRSEIVDPWGFVVDRIDGYLRKMLIARSSRPNAYLELVFWTYGGPQPTFTITKAMNHLWSVTYAGSGFRLVWPGMGQDPSHKPWDDEHSLRLERFMSQQREDPSD